MPSLIPRRWRTPLVVVVTVLLLIVYITSGDDLTEHSSFYRNTRNALDQQKVEQQAAEQAAVHAKALRDQQDAAGVQSRLSAAEEAAKKAANDKHQKYLDSVDGGGVGGAPGEKGVAGRVKYKDATTTVDKLQGVATMGGKARDTQMEEGETLEDHEVEVELNAILKKSPIIIFSKSYCPHSARAKRILTHKYTITPAPYIVELDEHPLGPALQARLAKVTHRSTVPNILVQGKSIGGGDEVAELDETGTLISKINEMTGSRADIKLNEQTGNADDGESAMKRRRRR